ncbi:interactor of constitutive active ROPs 3 [Carica papaya]|uniref:interactor of constitutive active ROPs 3 n=1 Tax=Carica papaya TaxID=3649 RepID=UPI000B8CAAF4|nr:interactor of constitutive active ROPs 3 [Carica papaya]XP_021912178.1 interactor of constitutive active ROPs 3 [Carica papaya]XP_021912179.1 interactor of constitutive active ROPs 3 [Carica papaya]
MQTPKSRSSTSEVPQKVSPRIVRQLKPTRLELESSASSNSASRTPKDRSPKVVERRSPRSPVTEKKRPSRISELESQISLLKEELKKTKDQLCASESCKKQAEQDVEDTKKQLSAMALKLEESQKQLLELTASEEVHALELQKISQESEQAWQSELKSVQNHHSVDAAALTSAMTEIQQLKVQLEMVAESEALQNKQTESANVELKILKGNLVETLSLVENMKTQLRESKESEVQVQELASETLLQLETAKRSVEALRSDGLKAIEAYNSIATELEQSRTRVGLLEELVNKLEADPVHTNQKNFQESTGDQEMLQENGNNSKSSEQDHLEEELNSLKAEVGRLRFALEAVEMKLQEEQIQSTVEIRSAYELVEQIKSGSSQSVAELETELKNAKSAIEELKANLMDKETELQGISEENESLQMKLEKNLACQREVLLENELKKLREAVVDLKANLMDKETEFQNISEENEILKLEISKREMDNGSVKHEVVSQVEMAKTAEREALLKLGLAMEEAEKSNRKMARVTEQLEAAQAANSEMEAELRRLKVQSDQWRKAAEAAAAMIPSGNNGKFMERTGSLDSNNYTPVTGKIISPYSEDMDDDLLKKKNGNMLKKIGVLWKKQPK